MKKEQLWDIFIAQNPAMQKDDVTLSVKALRRLFDITWDKAVASCREKQTEDDYINEVFGKMFNIRKG